MQSPNLGEMFVSRVQAQGTQKAVHFKEGRSAYQAMSWCELHTLVMEIAFGLAKLSVTPSQSVGIFAPTSHLWVAADFATICNGATSVPLYPNSSLVDVEHILNNSTAQVVFVSGEPLLKRLLQAKTHLPLIRKIIFIPPLTGHGVHDPFVETQESDRNMIITLADLQESGRLLALKEPELIRQRIQAITPDDIATIIYTSGTTAAPKGVPLSHANIISVLTDLPSIIPMKREDMYMSYLPLSHVFERVCGEFYWIASGCCCAFAESIESLSKNLAEVEPSIMLVVPRVLDRIYSKVRSGIEGATGSARELIAWSIKVGTEVLRLNTDDRPVSLTLKIKHWLAEKLVFGKLRERIGRRMRFIVSGGAPATPQVIEFFNAIGIQVLEGYGLTETSAPTNVNRFHKIKVGTVGPCLGSVQMKLANDGEILVKGPSIFKGYFKDEQATSQSFADNWFCTGDIGTIDGDGYLKITDRKKDLIINSAGKNIAPQHVESVLKTIPCVNQVIVFGDKRKHLVALFSLDQQALVDLAQEKGWQYKNVADLLASRQTHQYLKQEIHTRSKELAEYELVRNFAVLTEDLAIETGELTATLKVKRNVVGKKYITLIDSLYGQDSSEQKSTVGSANFSSTP